MSFDFSLATSFLRALSWTKLAQVFVLLSILVGFWLTYQFRANIYSTLKIGSITEQDQTVVIVLSGDTKTKINETVNKLPNFIAGIQVVNVNFQKNTRTISYSSISDASLKTAIYEYEQSALADTPLFSSSVINNRRIVDLVNGEFICTPYKDTLAGKNYPGGIQTVTTICSVSIPPHYGKFSGYLNIYLKHKPEGTEVDIIRQLANDISGRIYTTDILHEEKSKPRSLTREDIR